MDNQLDIYDISYSGLRKVEAMFEILEAYPYLHNNLF